MSIIVQNILKMILIFFIIITLNFVVTTPVNAKSTFGCCDDACKEYTVLLDKYPASKELQLAIKACKSGCMIIQMQRSVGKNGILINKTKKTIAKRCPESRSVKPGYVGYCKDSINYWVEDCDKNKIEEEKNSKNNYEYKKKTTYSKQNPGKYQNSDNNEGVAKCDRDYDSFMQDLTKALQSGNSKASIKPAQQVISCLKASGDSKSDPIIAQFEMMLKMMQR